MSRVIDTIHTGEIFDAGDKDLLDIQMATWKNLYEFNATGPTEFEKRSALLKKMFADIGRDCYIEPPFRCIFGGRHVHFGDAVYANYNLTLLDDTHIYVGDHTMFGPNVTICTSSHTICPEIRFSALQYNDPVHIGRNCWIGAGVIILPGVTIGENTVIGAGSVVAKNIPPSVVAVGNPCRVMRAITERDAEFYSKGRRIPDEIRRKYGVLKESKPESKL